MSCSAEKFNHGGYGEATFARRAYVTRFVNAAKDAINANRHGRPYPPTMGRYRTHGTPGRVTYFAT